MTDEKTRMAARAVLCAYLDEHKLRHTPERFAILDTVLAMPQRFDVAALYEAMEQEGTPVTRATVYHAVALLERCSLLRSHRFGSRTLTYERIMPSTQRGGIHLVCTSCGKVKDVRDTTLAAAIDQRGFSAFHKSYFTLDVYGVCSACVRRGRRARSKT